MKATIKELRRVMFDFDFNLSLTLVGIKKELTNSEGRRFLWEIENQNSEVEFYIGSSGIIVIETEINKS